MKGFERPPVIVLPATAEVPARNQISPPPNQFTHELTRSQPFYFSGPEPASPPEGEFPAGTKVVLLIHDGGGYCRVVDGRGLYVTLEYDSLRKL
jgi:hypothetical protein